MTSQGYTQAQIDTTADSTDKAVYTQDLAKQLKDKAAEKAKNNGDRAMSNMINSNKVEFIIG